MRMSRKYRIHLLKISSMRPKRFSVVIIVQNSVVQILNMKMIENSFRNFALANKSFVCFKNMTFIEDNVTATLHRVKESNAPYEIKFHRNKIGCLVSINLKSTVLITNNSLTGNEIIFKNAHSISRSLMKLNNTNFVVTK